MPKRTQAALDRIQSIIENEQVNLRKNLLQSITEDLSQGLDEEQKQELAEELKSLKLSNFSQHDFPGKQFSEKTLDTKQLMSRLESETWEATKGLEVTTAVAYFGQDHVEMTREELVDLTITRGVERQIKAMKRVSEITNSEQYRTLAARDGSVPRAVPPLSAEDEAAIRADLLAHRRAQYERGELDIEIKVFSSTWAATYNEPYTTIGMADGRQVTNEANASTFRDEWEMTEHRKAFFRQGIAHHGLEQYAPSLAQHADREEILRDIYS
ncbi:hypothetical protein K3723_11320 [Leisingera caerulea]|uniref:hypothetical protein n=1 Tax=Leisingera caerulea TaxID=506591 RepID=UPI0021A68C95|nr:hypothetical protein [Leisingera caerulea]UWQ61463.1 hypothetical protein K3723_11320 [Leisingera caerulea]